MTLSREPGYWRAQALEAGKALLIPLSVVALISTVWIIPDYTAAKVAGVIERIKPLLLSVLFILLAIYVGIQAKRHGRRRWLWTIIALIANPIFTWIVLALLPKRNEKTAGTP